MSGMARISAGIGLLGVVAVNLGGCGGVVDEQAEAEFKAKLGQTTLTVFPTLVRRGDEVSYDAEAARAFGGYFADNNLATVAYPDAEVPLHADWGMNQARMYRDSVAEFQRFLTEHPIDTEYAAMLEYLFLFGPNEKVGGVHLYVLRADGVCCFGFLANSHHKAFSEVNPQTVSDCTQVALERFAEELGR